MSDTYSVPVCPAMTKIYEPTCVAVCARRLKSWPGLALLVQWRVSEKTQSGSIADGEKSSVHTKIQTPHFRITLFAITSTENDHDVSN